jgi:hypothetical protein
MRSIFVTGGRHLAALLSNTPRTTSLHCAIRTPCFHTLSRYLVPFYHFDLIDLVIRQLDAIQERYDHLSISAVYDSHMHAALTPADGQRLHPDRGRRHDTHRYRTTDYRGGLIYIQ